MTDPLAQLAATLAAPPGQPLALFAQMEAMCQATVGHELFTLLYRGGAEVACVYSSRPQEYPVSGRKLMGPTPWGDLVLTNRQAFLGRDKDAIRWAFFDHALIIGMGLGSVINIPVVYDGQTIGTLNLLAPEYHYQQAHVAAVAGLAPMLVPAFLAARA
ncbi:MAG: GAF domain-containing protein [Candidatus Devosia euplotis]|nr:GAF domain-containing protein [Candidatus Devosia euplotis]